MRPLVFGNSHIGSHSLQGSSCFLTQGNEKRAGYGCGVDISLNLPTGFNGAT